MQSIQKVLYDVSTGEYKSKLLVIAVRCRLSDALAPGYGTRPTHDLHKVW